MSSYDKLERRFLFEPKSGTTAQHMKIVEEFEEVNDEVLIIRGREDLYFSSRNGIENYINEMMDLQMAINNQILRLENKFGTHYIKQCMDNWDDKLEDYRKNKYCHTK